MEESQERDEDRWGTIFMGPTSDRESTIDKLTERQQNELWSRRTEAEYMERVRRKATLRAQTMLDKARENGDVIRETARQWALKVKAECDAHIAEAENLKHQAEQIRSEAETIRENAREEGYKLGVEQAMMELDEHRAMLDDATASVLQTIGEQSGTLFEAWRAELAQLVQDAVTTATGWILIEEKHAILESLLTESFQQLEARRRLIIRVNESDRDAVDGIVRSAQERYPDLQSWEVVDDETIDPGGLVVESESGMVDNRTSNRREAMEEILQHLALPRGEAEEQAEAAVAGILDITGMTALAAEAEARSAQEMAALEQAETEELLEAAKALPESLSEEESPLLNEGDVPPEELPAEEIPVEKMPAESNDLNPSPEQESPPVQSEAHAVAAQAEVASLMQSLQSGSFEESELEEMNTPPDLAALARALPQGAEVPGVPDDSEVPGTPDEHPEEDIPVLEVTVNDADPALLEQVPDSELPPDTNEEIGIHPIQTAEA